VGRGLPLDHSQSIVVTAAEVAVDRDFYFPSQGVEGHGNVGNGGRK
jgi:hypothetical protein